MWDLDVLAAVTSDGRAYLFRTSADGADETGFCVHGASSNPPDRSPELVPRSQRARVVSLNSRFNLLAVGLAEYVATTLVFLGTRPGAN